VLGIDSDNIMSALVHMRSKAHVEHRTAHTCAPFTHLQSRSMLTSTKLKRTPVEGSCLLLHLATSACRLPRAQRIRTTSLIAVIIKVQIT